MKRIWPVGILIILTLIFFWRFFLRGEIPFPGDLLVGAYYPWLEYKWGYAVGVPVKNPLISDVFSAFYVWKKLVADSISVGKWPLWNPFSYSGYPLLANFHSGALYPLNLLLVVFGAVRGWAFLMIAQVIGIGVSMYSLIRQFKRSGLAAVLGAVIYSYSGFSISWMGFVTAGQAMIWLPLIFIFCERYGESKNWKELLWLPGVFFLIVTAGHFQILVYSGILLIAYFLYRRVNPVWILMVGGLSLGLAMVQLLPTVELMRHSVRFGESYIQQMNFGLSPMANLITLLAPDFFGNPTTGNFWGFFNYHETVFYLGIVGVFSVIFGLYRYKSLGAEKFFVVLAILSLLLGFDTALGKAIYSFKVPGLYTSAAGRIAVLWVLSASVLAGMMADEIKKVKLGSAIKMVSWLWLGLLIAGITALWARGVFETEPAVVSQWLLHIRVGLRNLVIPAVVLGAFSGLMFIRKSKIFLVLVIALTAAELFRFGWKYLPFVKPLLVFPETEVLSFLKQQEGVFRIDREKAPLLTANTWAVYGLQSPSGYDPMAVADYVSGYNLILNDDKESKVSRYSELGRYDAKSLGEFNVKYFLALKEDKEGRIGLGDELNSLIDRSQWDTAFETRSVVVLENKFFQPRVRLNGEAKIKRYEANLVEIEYKATSDTDLVLADSWYPGWRAWVSGKEERVEKEGVFRRVRVPKGEGSVRFEYEPKSFQIGLKISLITSLILVLLSLGVIGKRKKQQKRR